MSGAKRGSAAKAEPKSKCWICGADCRYDRNVPIRRAVGGVPCPWLEYVNKWVCPNAAEPWHDARRRQLENEASARAETEAVRERQARRQRRRLQTAGRPLAFLPPGIDPDFRPVTYFSPIASQARGLSFTLLGECLPKLEGGEVEIARVELLSTAGDAISIRARPEDGGIAYHIADGHGTEYRCRPDWSRAPLNFAQLVRLMERSGIVIGILEDNRRGRSDLSTLETFLSVRSAHYRDLWEYWDARIAAWIDVHRGKRKRRAAEPEIDSQQLNLCLTDEGED